MASTYTTSLKIQLIGSGEQSGVWGNTTNTNWNLIEQATAGVVQITMANADYTLSNLNGVSDEARNMVIEVGGTNSDIRKVVIPLVEKMYIVTNSTSGGYAITVGASTGSYVTIPNGYSALVYCDATNTISGVTSSAGSFSVNGNLTVTGNETVVSALSAGSLSVSGASAFAGTTTAPTVSTGDNSTNVATTAFVKAYGSSLGLGTMATQNANAVAITGGTITGLSNLTSSSATISGALSAGSGSVSGALSVGTTLGVGGTMTAAALGGNAALGYGASGTWGINISGNAATVTNGVYNNGGTYSINISGNSATSTLATTATGANYVNTSGGQQYFNWSGQSGQPTWLWGANAVGNAYLYNPANFSVNYSSTSGTSSYVSINYNNDSNSTYQMLWGSGNGVYGTSGIYCNPYTDYVYAGSFSTGGFFRSQGATGWYNDTYGGGIYMADSTYVRTYGSKSFYCDQTIYAAGNVVAAYSDERFKNKIGAIENALDKVGQLTGFLYINSELANSFGYNDKKTQVGLSAQDVQKVQPEAVTLAPVDMLIDPETQELKSASGENYLTVDYSRLVPLLVEAIKELKAEVDQLKGK